MAQAETPLGRSGRSAPLTRDEVNPLYSPTPEEWDPKWGKRPLQTSEDPKSKR